MAESDRQTLNGRHRAREERVCILLVLRNISAEPMPMEVRAAGRQGPGGPAMTMKGSYGCWKGPHFSAVEVRPTCPRGDEHRAVHGERVHLAPSLAGHPPIAKLCFTTQKLFIIPVCSLSALHLHSNVFGCVLRLPSTIIDCSRGPRPASERKTSQWPR